MTLDKERSKPKAPWLWRPILYWGIGTVRGSVIYRHYPSTFLWGLHKTCTFVANSVAVVEETRISHKNLFTRVMANFLWPYFIYFYSSNLLKLPWIWFWLFFRQRRAWSDSHDTGCLWGKNGYWFPSPPPRFQNPARARHGFACS